MIVKCFIRLTTDQYWLSTGCFSFQNCLNVLACHLGDVRQYPKPKRLPKVGRYIFKITPSNPSDPGYKIFGEIRYFVAGVTIGNLFLKMDLTQPLFIFGLFKRTIQF